MPCLADPFANQVSCILMGRLFLTATRNMMLLKEDRDFEIRFFFFIQNKI